MKSFLVNELILRKIDLFEIFYSCIEKNNGGLFTYYNQNSFNISYKNIEYINILHSFNVYQEGIGMYLALKIKKFKNFDRIDATEVHKLFLDTIISKKHSIIFIGGKFNDVDIKNRCNIRGLDLEYYYHGFLQEDERNELIKKLKNTKAKFVLLGMGSPQQEMVAYNLFQHFPDKIFICVGNFMNYFLGYQKRAPIIFRKLQLEWLYRLFQEPKRLFKRYVIGIPLFFYRVFFHFK